ncbi:MAG: GNAT family N-acetyltransferase [Chloroflexi bacterium]|jgi:hypothetical protein|nr:GNAT family N-acetyltransferase [Chloroflexota bacterium]
MILLATAEQHLAIRLFAGCWPLRAAIGAVFEGREGGSVDVDVLYNDERVTKAQTVFVSWGRCVIGPDTLPPYQRRGHSHLAACGSIEQALARGLTPEWYASNSRASVVRTLDLGFASTRLANVVRVGPGVGAGA